MTYRTFFAIIPTSLYQEFIEKLTELEEQHEVSRDEPVKTKGNNFGMTGDTYHFSYEKKGKYSVFQHELRVFWSEFNKVHPKTCWKGK
jgi:hypothetical protein